MPGTCWGSCNIITSVFVTAPGDTPGRILVSLDTILLHTDRGSYFFMIGRIDAKLYLNICDVSFCGEIPVTLGKLQIMTYCGRIRNSHPISLIKFRPNHVVQV